MHRVHSSLLNIVLHEWRPAPILTNNARQQSVNQALAGSNPASKVFPIPKSGTLISHTVQS